jgi:hypothetical protein
MYLPLRRRLGGGSSPTGRIPPPYLIPCRLKRLFGHDQNQLLRRDRPIYSTGVKICPVFSSDRKNYKYIE